MKIKSFLKKNNLTYRNYITSNNSNNNIMYFFLNEFILLYY